MQKADRNATDQPFIEESGVLVFQDLWEEEILFPLFASYLYV